MRVKTNKTTVVFNLKDLKLLFTNGYKMSIGKYNSINYLKALFKLFRLFISLPSFTNGQVGHSVP